MFSHSQCVGYSPLPSTKAESAFWTYKIKIFWANITYLKVVNNGLETSSLPDHLLIFKDKTLDGTNGSRYRQAFPKGSSCEHRGSNVASMKTNLTVCKAAGLWGIVVKKKNHWGGCVDGLKSFPAWREKKKISQFYRERRQISVAHDKLLFLSVFSLKQLKFPPQCRCVCVEWKQAPSCLVLS